MKMAIIEELLDPLNVVLENLSDADDIAHLKLALNKVRSDLSSFFGDLFEAEDYYANELADDDDVDDVDAAFRATLLSVYEDELF